MQIVDLLRPGAKFVMGDGLVLAFEPGEQVFAYGRDTAPDEPPIIFSVRRLAELHATEPQNWTTLDIDVTEERAAFVSQRHGIEAKHMPRVSATVDVPGYGVFLEDDSFLLVDGNHRYFLRYANGLDSMAVHICLWPHWRPATIDLSASMQRGGVS